MIPRSYVPKVGDQYLNNGGKICTIIYVDDDVISGEHTDGWAYTMRKENLYKGNRNLIGYEPLSDIEWI